jgi:predicted membrane protein
MINFSGWWTLFIIIPAVGSMISSRINIVNSILFLLGLWLLIREQGWFESEILHGVTISAMLIVLGLGLIISEFRKKNRSNELSYNRTNEIHKTDYNEAEENASQKSEAHGEEKSSAGNRQRESSNDHVSILSMFGLNQSRNTSKSLKGGEATALFGGVELDLADSTPVGDVTFYVNAAFGGVDIIPPRNFNVEISGVSLLGGVDNKINRPFAEGLPTFTIKYFTLCGGIDIVEVIK